MYEQIPRDIKHIKGLKNKSSKNGYNEECCEDEELWNRIVTMQALITVIVPKSGEASPPLCYEAVQTVERNWAEYFCRQP